MQLGMIGLGRMGANMVRRLMRGGHECIVYDRNADAVKQLVGEGAIATFSLEEFVERLRTPRAIWIMVPAAVVDEPLDELKPLLHTGDIVIDGGNSHYIDDIRRSEEMAALGIDYVDVGTSGGIWGLERGYCLMIGGPKGAADHLDPIFMTLAPGRGSIDQTKGRDKFGSTAEEGYLHCGPSGAGHFVKMAHNGIEYGIMAAYAEGFNLLRHANLGKVNQKVGAELTPLRHSENYQYDLKLADIAEVWRRGSVITSWLLDLTAIALAEDPEVSHFAGQVADSGEGRWAILAAVETGTPVPVLSNALFSRYASRGEDDFANRLLSAMRFQFGGHHAQP